MTHSLLQTLIALILVSSATLSQACSISAQNLNDFQQLKQRQFVVQEVGTRHQTLLDLGNCLGDPNSVIRDDIAFSGISTILRRDPVDPKTKQALKDRLMAQVKASDNEHGVRRSFSILALSEIARSQRLAPFMNVEEQQALIDLTSEYLTKLRDYRGFDPQIGWRHGIAHAADLAMQLILDPNTQQQQVEQLLQALFSQAVPDSGHIYVHGEAHRLARPILFAAARGFISEEQWRDWFKTVSHPKTLKNWDAAFSSEKGLAQRHNARQFLLELYAGARDSTQAAIAQIAPWVRESLRTIP